MARGGLDLFYVFRWSYWRDIAIPTLCLSGLVGLVMLPVERLVFLAPVLFRRSQEGLTTWGLSERSSDAVAIAAAVLMGLLVLFAGLVAAWLTWNAGLRLAMRLDAVRGVQRGKPDS